MGASSCLENTLDCHGDLRHAMTICSLPLPRESVGVRVQFLNSQWIATKTFGFLAMTNFFTPAITPKDCHENLWFSRNDDPLPLQLHQKIATKTPLKEQYVYLILRMY